MAKSIHSNIVIDRTKNPFYKTDISLQNRNMLLIINRFPLVIFVVLFVFMAATGNYSNLAFAAEHKTNDNDDNTVTIPVPKLEPTPVPVPKIEPPKIDPPDIETEPVPIPVPEIEVENVEVPVPKVKTDDGQGGGCLIATAAYGTELAPQVQMLREIRDHTLLSTTSGAAFMTGFNQLYYSFSPTIADMERDNPLFKETVRTFITPMISTLSIMSLADEGSESSVLGLGISVIALNLGMYIVAPTIAGFAINKHLKSRKSKN